MRERERERWKQNKLYLNHSQKNLTECLSSSSIDLCQDRDLNAVRPMSARSSKRKLTFFAAAALWAGISICGLSVCLSDGDLASEASARSVGRSAESQSLWPAKAAANQASDGVGLWPEKGHGATHPHRLMIRAN